MRLWTALAARYRDRTSVLGYDLLNEPLPNEWQHVYAAELMDLYRQLTAAIREVDPHHLIMYEGIHWATDFTPFTEPLDDNCALQFHRYWCAPGESSIAHHLEARERLQRPIYMGEGGENTPGVDLRGLPAVRTLRHRLELLAAEEARHRHLPLVHAHARRAGTGSRIPRARPPTPEDAWRTLESFLELMATDRCERRAAVTDALFARGSLRLAAWSGVDRDESGPAGRALQDAPDSLWQHGAGEPYDASERAHAVAAVCGGLLAVCVGLGARPMADRRRPPRAR